MPKSPDFDQIARRIMDMGDSDSPTLVGWIVVADIAEQLQQVWNARGAADVAAVASRLMSDSSMTAAIKELDR